MHIFQLTNFCVVDTLYLALLVENITPLQGGSLPQQSDVWSNAGESNANLQIQDTTS